MKDEITQLVTPPRLTTKPHNLNRTSPESISRPQVRRGANPPALGPNKPAPPPSVLSLPFSVLCPPVFFVAPRPCAQAIRGSKKTLYTCRLPSTFVENPRQIAPFARKTKPISKAIESPQTLISQRLPSIPRPPDAKKQTQFKPNFRLAQPPNLLQIPHADIQHREARHQHFALAEPGKTATIDPPAGSATASGRNENQRKDYFKENRTK